MIETNVTYVPGDDDQVYACITSPTRPFRRHIWVRAIVHLWRMKDVPFEVCNDAIDSIIQHTRYLPPDDPEKMIKPPQFSWKGIPGKL